MQVGYVPVTIRLRIDAGVPDTQLNEVGQAEATIQLPVTTVTTGRETSLTVDNESFVATIEAIIKAASKVIQARHGILGAFDNPIAAICSDHRVVQHRDNKPPWCKLCGLTAEGKPPAGSINETRQAMGLPPYEETS